MAKNNSQLKGEVFLLTNSDQSFTRNQIDLLIAIRENGSISKAAKQAGISYKTAWDRIDAMNNMSDKPLVIRSTGGAKGGGTSLTDFGLQIIEGFQAVQEEHQAFVERLGSRLHSLTDVANFVRSNSVQTSARNQFRGEITHIELGAVNAEIEIRISDTQTLTAIVTNDSIQRLSLKSGNSIIALIKASWVLLTKEIEVKTSARNRLIGHIEKIDKGAVNSDITVDLGDGKSISAVITNNSVAELALNKGDVVCAFFKASSVILMAD